MTHEKKHRIIGIIGVLFLATVLLLNVVLVNNAAKRELARKEAELAALSPDAVSLKGTGKGIDGDVVVQIIADAEHIYDVQILQQNETQGIGSVAVEQLPGEIVKNNSILVDGITGATVTSNAIKTAIREALASGGFDPAVFEVELAAAAPVEKTDETLECDVLVVGAGGAGLTAAVRANQEGADVLVIEKMPMVGGNSNRAEGGMNAAGTKLEEELGLLDPSLGELQSTVENYIADTYRLGHDLANMDLVRTLAENSSEAIDWLGSIGAPFTDVEPTGGCKGRKYLHQPEGGEPVGEYLVTRLSKVIADQGIEVMLNTKATELIVEDGQVVGVKAEDKEHNYTIRANAVVLATGGFGANFELMSSYDPSLANAVTTNHSGATGDGIMMAQAIGADTVDMEQIQLHPTVIQENGLLVSESLRSKGAIIVNTEGKRFVNDLAARDVVSQAELKQPDGYCYIVFDQALVDGLSLAQKFIDRGFAISGATYEELGKNIGLSDEAVKNFVATMEKWNEDVKNGEDTEWGRESLDYDLTTAPFYAIKIAPGIHHTMGGIKIDTEAQVIDTDGNVIPGLFAAGETTGGIHGGNRVGGNAVCDFVVFGRIAGANAAAFAAEGVLAAAA
ncbi:MAG: flavocytochrome c [Oscillospiraceae bacterium]|nr:flavocytochrome c [Oscillospiraceae bacterium]